MYWSELGSKSIKRAGMDGSAVSVFMEQVGRVHSMAIDLETRALYWAALDPPVIEFAYLNGTARRVLFDKVPMPYALALHKNKVFWGDWNTGKWQINVCYSILFNHIVDIAMWNHVCRSFIPPGGSKVVGRSGFIMLPHISDIKYLLVFSLPLCPKHSVVNVKTLLIPETLWW